MRRSPFLSLSGARPLSELLATGGRQWPDSLAYRPSLCSILHILMCTHKSLKRRHCSVRLLQHGNGVADSLPNSFVNQETPTLIGLTRFTTNENASMAPKHNLRRVAFVLSKIEEILSREKATEG